MIAKVDGQAVPADALWWPAMNFGQFRWPAPVGGYELELPRATFLERLQSPYRKLVEELKADDPHDPEGIPHLREIGYPPLVEVLDHPRQLAELVSVFLYEDVFEAFLSPVPGIPARFMINSVDGVLALPTVIILRGRGYYGPTGFAASG